MQGVYFNYPTTVMATPAQVPATGLQYTPPLHLQGGTEDMTIQSPAVTDPTKSQFSKDCSSERRDLPQICRSIDNAADCRRVRLDSCSMQYTNDVFYQNGAAPVAPSHFVFPASLHHNTPTTHSIHPVLGSKTGFSIPQSPNLMTNSQFANFVQSPGFAYPSGLPTPVTPAAEPAIANNGGRTVNRSGEVSEVTRGSYFQSPFKKFVRFTGSPSTESRFPLGAPPSAHRKQFPPNPRTNNQNWKRRDQGANKVNNRRPSESKGGFYMAGERFGQKVQPEEPNKDVESVTPPIRKVKIFFFEFLSSFAITKIFAVDYCLPIFNIYVTHMEFQNCFAQKFFYICKHKTHTSNI